MTTEPEFTEIEVFQEVVQRNRVTYDDACEMRVLRTFGAKLDDLARAFGTTKQNVSLILQGKTHRPSPHRRPETSPREYRPREYRPREDQSLETRSIAQKTIVVYKDRPKYARTRVDVEWTAGPLHERFLSPTAICRRRSRKALLEEMGSKCVRCGFDDSRALQVDHIHGGGRGDRSGRMTTENFYRKIRENPDDFQLLCANCNTIKRHEKDELPFAAIRKMKASKVLSCTATQSH